ncbi:hypothetical protein V6N13_102873 [Hibiscus sabdariffa]
MWPTTYKREQFKARKRLEGDSWILDVDVEVKEKGQVMEDSEKVEMLVQEGHWYHKPLLVFSNINCKVALGDFLRANDTRQADSHVCFWQMYAFKREEEEEIRELGKQIMRKTWLHEWNHMVLSSKGLSNIQWLRLERIVCLPLLAEQPTKDPLKYGHSRQPSRHTICYTMTGNMEHGLP